MDIGRVREQVKYNCNVSDAGYWGYYSICGLLLRMRDLFRSEQGLEFYEPIDMARISPWIEERDSLWRSLQNEELRNLEIGSECFPPFAVDEINRALSGTGLLYGAGYGRHMKPNFFLARLEEVRSGGDCDVYITGRELERDIDTVPAMLQGKKIFVRKERVKGLLWEKFHEMASRKYAGVLDYAFGEFGISRDDAVSEGLDRRIDEVVERVTELLVLHETGEAMEDRGPEAWLDLLARFRGSKEEYVLRAIKDVLADCSEHGPIKFIVSSEDRGLLGFYVALLTGLHKAVFPEMIEAFQEFAECDKWEKIEEVRERGYYRFLGWRERVVSTWNDSGDRKAIEKILDGLKNP